MRQRLCCADVRAYLTGNSAPPFKNENITYPLEKYVIMQEHGA